VQIEVHVNFHCQDLLRAPSVRNIHSFPSYLPGFIRESPDSLHVLAIQNFFDFLTQRHNKLRHFVQKSWESWLAMTSHKPIGLITRLAVKPNYVRVVWGRQGSPRGKSNISLALTQAAACMISFSLAFRQAQLSRHTCVGRNIMKEGQEKQKPCAIRNCLVMQFTNYIGIIPPLKNPQRSANLFQLPSTGPILWILQKYLPS